jgi:hypothetical protein
MYSTPDKSAQTIRLLVALLGIALALIGWYRFVD